jgi:hypothetical protein
MTQQQYIQQIFTTSQNFCNGQIMDADGITSLCDTHIETVNKELVI